MMTIEIKEYEETLVLKQSVERKTGLVMGMVKSEHPLVERWMPLTLSEARLLKGFFDYSFKEKEERS